MKQHKYTRFPKGVLLDCKRVRFGQQKESFYNAKGALLECKRTPFCDDMQQIHFSYRTFTKNNIFPTELSRKSNTFPTELRFLRHKYEYCHAYYGKWDSKKTNGGKHDKFATLIKKSLEQTSNIKPKRPAMAKALTIRAFTIAGRFGILMYLHLFNTSTEA